MKTGEKVKTIAIDETTFNKLKEMSPGGSISLYLRQLVDNPDLDLTKMLERMDLFEKTLDALVVTQTVASINSDAIEAALTQEQRDQIVEYRKKTGMDIHTWMKDKTPDEIQAAFAESMEEDFIDGIKAYKEEFGEQ